MQSVSNPCIIPLAVTLIAKKREVAGHRESGIGFSVERMSKENTAKSDTTLKKLDDRSLYTLLSVELGINPPEASRNDV